MRTRPFATLLSSLLLLLAAQPAVVRAEAIQPVGLSISLSNTQQASHARAVQYFGEQRYAAAYGRFAQLADAGHVPSAQMALLMVRSGPALFGSDWSATLAQQQRWNALVINSARYRFDFVDNERGD